MQGGMGSGMGDGMGSGMQVGWAVGWGGMGPSGGLPIDGLGNAAFATNHMAHIPASGGDASSVQGYTQGSVDLLGMNFAPQPSLSGNGHLALQGVHPTTNYQGAASFSGSTNTVATASVMQQGGSGAGVMMPPPTPTSLPEDDLPAMPPPPPPGT